MIDRASFFNHIRSKPFNGSLSGSQVAGMTRILDEWERRKLTDVRWLAYMLATTFHETARGMEPVREYGGEAYLRSKPYYPWVGEGLVQVTWETNARKFGATKPGDCMTWPVALSALFDGMIKGVFTSHKLSDYFGVHTNDPTGARRIINGTDKAAMIAGYHASFLTALGSVTATLAPVIPAVATPGPIAVGPHVTGVKAEKPLSGWAKFWAGVKRGWNGK